MTFEEAVAKIEAMEGTVYRDPSHKYVWIILCPPVLGRRSYGCSTSQSLIDWVEGLT